MKAAFVFLCLFALDFFWAKYTYAMTNKQPVAAGSWAAVIIVLSGGAAVSYVNDPWMLIPAGLGAFAGTYMAVMREAKR